jgi:DNA-3-methyladenine glycosylase II
VELFLEPVPPFRLDLTAWTLRRRPINAVDRWDGRTYRRALMSGGRAVDVAVVQTGSPDSPRLRVTVAGRALKADARNELVRDLERLLGLKIDLAGFYAFAAEDARLADLVSRFRGVKPPRFPTVFEALVNGIACQQISLTVGLTVLNRLVEHFGAAAGGTRVFPRPEDLAGQDPEKLRALGFSRQKARALLEAAGAAADGHVDLEGLAVLDDETAKQRLLSLRGVGRWTAEYVMVRGLGRTHVFPGDDVGARKRLAQWLGLPEPLDYGEVQKALQPWHPYAGLVYFHMLLRGLAEKGYLA